MPRRLTNPVPEIEGIDLDVRPESYWADRDPLSSIVQNIKGQNRREMARDFIAGGADAALGPIESSLLEDTLPAAERISLGRIHPSFMGGEYLPDYARGEVEIARLVLDSVTQDVFSVRARRTRPGARIRYRLVDEYESDFQLDPASSTRPLSLRELVHLLDFATAENRDNLGLPFPESILGWQRGWGEPVNAGFVAMESVFYPGLQEYYAHRLEAYADACNAEDFEEEEEEEEEEEPDEAGEGDVA